MRIGNLLLLLICFVLSHKDFCNSFAEPYKEQIQTPLLLPDHKNTERTVHILQKQNQIIIKKNKN